MEKCSTGNFSSVAIDVGLLSYRMLVGGGGMTAPLTEVREFGQHGHSRKGRV